MEKEYGWLDKARENARKFDDVVEESARRFDKAMDLSTKEEEAITETEDED